MDYSRLAKYISQWLLDYCEKSKVSGFVVGISGGIDSAVTSTLCAQTGKKTILVNLPIKQSESEYYELIMARTLTYYFLTFFHWDGYLP